MTNTSARLKQFVMSAQLAEHELSLVEEEFDVDLGVIEQKTAEEISNDYYPQIEKNYRDEAKKMAPHYEIFYSLEKSVRSLISETLHDADGPNWWDGERISDEIRKNVRDSIKREQDSGITARSEEEIDFCTFGELAIIIEKNWDLFGGIFTNQKALKSVMYRLNSLRNPIAHCALLADDEILRLQLTVKDWFRLME